MYNVRGHPWSRLLNPKKIGKRTKTKSCLQRLKNKFLDKKIPIETYLKEFWESNHLNRSKDPKIDEVV